MRSEYHDFLKTIPPEIPQHAVAKFAFIDRISYEGETGILRSTPGGVVQTQVVLANAGSNAIEANFLCIKNSHLESCVHNAESWTALLGAKELAAAPVEMNVRSGDRLDFLVLFTGDHLRPQPSSIVLTAFVDTRSVPAQKVIAGPFHAKVLGGCDFATLVTSDKPSKTFRPPGVQSISSQLFLLAELCFKGSPELLRLVPIADRRQQLETPDEFWNRAIRVKNKTLVIPIPRRQQIRELQVVVLRLTASPISPAWITHSVRFSD